jgi:soluble lytic murein transglycosylase-like protein
MNASLVSHIGAKAGISNKLLVVFLLLFGAPSSAQTPPSDAASRLEASVQRQMLSVTRMKTTAIEASISRQKNSVAKQLGPEASGAFFLLPPPAASVPGSAEPECPALPSAEVDELVTQAGKASSVSPDLLRSVMKEESGFYPCAVSGKGAMGLMQLMGPTANELGVRNAFDPRENVTAGAKFLRQLLDLYSGDLTLALSAYNAGPGRVDASLGIPEIPETMDYVNRVLSVLQASEPAKRSGAAAQSVGDHPLSDDSR